MSCSPLESGSWACTFVEAQLPTPVHPSELISGRHGSCCSEFGQCLCGEPGPGRGAEPLVHRQRGAEMFLGAGGVAERGGQCAEVVVHCCVVGGAAGDQDVGARQGQEPLVHPGPLGGAPGDGEHDRGRGKPFRAGRFGDVQDAEITQGGGGGRRRPFGRRAARPGRSGTSARAGRRWSTRSAAPGHPTRPATSERCSKQARASGTPMARPSSSACSPSSAASWARPAICARVARRVSAPHRPRAWPSASASEM